MSFCVRWLTKKPNVRRKVFLRKYQGSFHLLAKAFAWVEFHVQTELSARLVRFPLKNRWSKRILQSSGTDIRSKVNEKHERHLKTDFSSLYLAKALNERFIQKAHEKVTLDSSLKHQAKTKQNFAEHPSSLGEIIEMSMLRHNLYWPPLRGFLFSANDLLAISHSSSSPLLRHGNFLSRNVFFFSFRLSLALQTNFCMNENCLFKNAIWWRAPSHNPASASQAIWLGKLVLEIVARKNATWLNVPFMKVCVIYQQQVLRLGPKP